MTDPVLKALTVGFGTAEALDLLSFLVFTGIVAALAIKGRRK